MLDIDHAGNMIDVNKTGGRLPISLSKIAIALIFHDAN